MIFWSVWSTSRRFEFPLLASSSPGFVTSSLHSASWDIGEFGKIRYKVSYLDPCLYVRRSWQLNTQIYLHIYAVLWAFLLTRLLLSILSGCQSSSHHERTGLPLNHIQISYKWRRILVMIYELPMQEFRPLFSKSSSRICASNRLLQTSPVNLHIYRCIH